MTTPRTIITTSTIALQEPFHDQVYPRCDLSTHHRETEAGGVFVIEPVGARVGPLAVMLVRPPGVYRAQDDTSLLREVLCRDGRAAGCSVLDVGAGTGALAIEAGLAGAARVTAVDLSRRSAFASWLNSHLRGIPATVRRGDLFSPVTSDRFDLVLANPPYMPAASGRLPRHRMARCWDAGPNGRNLLDRICAEVPSVLNEDGSLLLVQSQLAGEEATLHRLEKANLSSGVVGRGRVPFGPVMRARAPLLRARGLLAPGQVEEELVVIEARNE